MRAEPFDLAVSYERDAPKLKGLVARNISAPQDLIEEACQIAWSRLYARDEELEAGAVFGWLATTAHREALHLLRLRARELRLDDPDQCGHVIDLPTRVAGPEQVNELRERLTEVRSLPTRQQRMLWLQGFGYEYEEIAARTGDSRRTVERQLSRARRHLKLVTEDAIA